MQRWVIRFAELDDDCVVVAMMVVMAQLTLMMIVAAMISNVDVMCVTMVECVTRVVMDFHAFGSMVRRHRVICRAMGIVGRMQWLLRSTLHRISIAEFVSQWLRFVF